MASTRYYRPIAHPASKVLIGKSFFPQFLLLWSEVEEVGIFSFLLIQPSSVSVVSKFGGRVNTMALMLTQKTEQFHSEQNGWVFHAGPNTSFLGPNQQTPFHWRQAPCSLQVPFFLQPSELLGPRPLKTNSSFLAL